MVNVPLLSQYRKLGRWLGGMSYARRALLTAMIFFTVWMSVTFLLDDEFLQISALFGGLTALALGILQYWADRSS